MPKIFICEYGRPCGEDSCIWIDEWSSFVCKCQTGNVNLNKSCSENICQLNPCYNGGTCLNPNPENKICQCPKEYGGLLCQTKIVPTTVLT
ncbi:neural-cadherin isoform X8 [Brachionus plicatilis]|uniref:Neural-cadherin isoform X8 n=1 Tax=Brachionus plicatilis TaxID=10195 RepID=A0A3M7RZ72_BRAPC|nr:neural-cadherin isoform X8 [Brachionus plicatilis]